MGSAISGSCSRGSRRGVWAVPGAAGLSPAGCRHSRDVGTVLGRRAAHSEALGTTPPKIQASL